VGFDFAEVGADALFAAGIEGLRDGDECVSVNVVTVGGRAVHVALY
jgi:hypothetical protein